MQERRKAEYIIMPVLLIIEKKEKEKGAGQEIHYHLGSAPANLPRCLIFGWRMQTWHL